jgi:flagellar biosynthesis protein FlhG
MAPVAARASVRAPKLEIIAIGSGLSGVGSTWVAIQLATDFANRGERVLLVDAGGGKKPASSALSARCEEGVSAVVTGKVTLKEAVVAIAGGAGKGGFDLIKADASKPVQIWGDDLVQSIAAGITALAFDYDRVLIDLADGIGTPSVRLAACADGLLVVASPSNDSLTQAYSLIKSLRTRRPDCPVGVIANQVKTAGDADKVYGSIARACAAHLSLEPARAGSFAVSERLGPSVDLDAALLG